MAIPARPLMSLLTEPVAAPATPALQSVAGGVPAAPKIPWQSEGYEQDLARFNANQASSYPGVFRRGGQAATAPTAAPAPQDWLADMPKWLRDLFDPTNRIDYRPPAAVAPTLPVAPPTSTPRAATPLNNGFPLLSQLMQGRV